MANGMVIVRTREWRKTKSWRTRARARIVELKVPAGTVRVSVSRHGDLWVRGVDGRLAVERIGERTVAIGTR